MKLPPVLDIGAAAPLRSQLMERRGQPLELDASAVERLGGLCLQVLIAARNLWSLDGVKFAILDPSPAFAEGVDLSAAFDLAAQGGGS
jgi:chemotaxis protein CheX